MKRTNCCMKGRKLLARACPVQTDVMAGAPDSGPDAALGCSRKDRFERKLTYLIILKRYDN